DIVNECVSQARELQSAGDYPGALAKVNEILVNLPNEVRLVQLRATLQALFGESSRRAGVPPDNSTVENPAAGGIAEVRNPSLPQWEEYREPVVTTGQSEDTLPLPPAITPTSPHNPEQANRGLLARSMDSLRTGAVAASSMHRGRFSLAHWFMFALFPAIL